MQISVSSQTTLNNAANNFVFALYDASAPSVLLESQAPAKPYGVPLQVTFTYNCVSGHIYIIRLWESADTTPTGVVRNSFSQSVQSNTSTITLKMDEYLEADVTTGLTSGTTAYVNTDWAGWVYSIERIGQGTMVPISSGDTDPNYSINVLGGFNLTQTGDTFQPNEKFVVRFIPQVTTGPTPAGTPSPVFSAGQIITANKTLTSADSGQALILQGASNKLAVTMPPLSSVADFTFFYFFSNGGSHINAVLQAAGTDKFSYNGNQSQIILGQCEVARVYKAFGVWNLENELTGVNKVGETFFAYSNTIINSAPFAGQLLDRTVYARAWAFVQSLPSGSILSDTAWSSSYLIVDGQNIYTGKGFFSTGDGSTTFRMPLLTDKMLKGSDGVSRTIGDLELDQLLSHEHEETIGLLPTSLFGRGQVTRVVGNYNRTSSLVSDLTGPPTDNQGNNLVRVGNENKVRNISNYLMMRI